MDERSEVTRRAAPAPVTGVRATLETRLHSVVGGRTAAALERAFAMETVDDLLWHLPRRYSNRGELTPLAGLPIGEHVTVLAQVLDARERKMQRRGGSLIEVRITDGTGLLQLTFFNQAWRAATLLPGSRGIFSGKVSEYRGHLQLQHPDYELFDEPRITPERDAELTAAAARAYAERPIPLYPATAKLPSWTIARAVELVLDALDPLSEPLPPAVREHEGILPLATAIELVHRPRRAVDWRRAQESLRFREAFDLQLSLLDRRLRLGRAPGTARPRQSGGLLDAFDAELPFELTAGQRAAGDRVTAELAEPHPMQRLLQGEVGSGKTLVALRAMLQVAESGGQSALLAPTEVLAGQHARSIVEALGPELTARLTPVLLTGGLPAAARRRALLDIAAGGAKIVIGTHALLGDQVSFFDLGLVVVDEQHRFGVEQRETLRRKGAVAHRAPVGPHLLAMTATPIPRTVALTAFGDLETSTIRELPPGRPGIETFAVPVIERPAWAERAWRRATEEVSRGRQVYVVCPAIAGGTRDEGEEPEAGEDVEAETEAGTEARPLASVEQTLRELGDRADFAQLRLTALTGAMRSEEKDTVMREFADGRIDVLVATSVIEVGLNVPNATMMVVRDAERFGISQLHQLRGRVGRGSHAGLCLLLTSAPEGSPGRARVDAVAGTTDGFALAEIDLELRREGDILGTAQSGGRSTLRLLRVAEHGDVIERARSAAAQVLERDPELERSPLLAARLSREREAGRIDNLAKS